MTDAVQRIRVLIVDDHAVVRMGLRAFFDLLPDIEVVGEASDGSEGVAMTRRLTPDVVLMDLLMPNMDGITAIGRIKAELPETEIVTMTSFIEEEKVTAALEAGASGFKLHPRSDAFALPHPVVEEVVALAHERRRLVLFHAGRGIPHLGESVVDLARRYPGARLILAHAGISDLSWIAGEAAALPNLFFDTAWWNVADHLQLYSTIPPGQILYASDMPYGPGVVTSFIFLRMARAVGHPPAVARAIAGEQVARIVAGEEPLDLGPAPGVEAVGPRVIDAERIVTYASGAVLLAFRGLDPAEPVALARLACRTSRDGDVAQLLGLVDRVLEIGQEWAAARPDQPFAIGGAALVALILAGTPAAGVPAVAL